MPVWRPVSERPGQRPGARARRGPRPQTTRTTHTTRTGGADTLGNALSALPVWQGRLAIMAACTVPGVLIRLSGVHIPPPLGMVVFGGAVMAAAFMLASAAEAAEIDAPPGIAVAGVALVAVLPEYVIEVYFAFSGRVEFVTASLTGSTRLLLSFAVGMPAIASLVLARRGTARLRTVELGAQKRVDLAIIATASLYAPLIVLRGHLAWPDAVVLISLYVLYLRRVATGSPEPPHLVGVAAELGKLPQRQRGRWVGGIMLFSACAVLITAEPSAGAAPRRPRGGRGGSTRQGTARSKPRSSNRRTVFSRTPSFCATRTTGRHFARLDLEAISGPFPKYARSADTPKGAYLQVFRHAGGGTQPPTADHDFPPHLAWPSRIQGWLDAPLDTTAPSAARHSACPGA
jgi:hypothetical protein